MNMKRRTPSTSPVDLVLALIMPLLVVLLAIVTAMSTSGCNEAVRGIEFDSVNVATPKNGAEPQGDPAGSLYDGAPGDEATPNALSNDETDAPADETPGRTAGDPGEEPADEVGLVGNGCQPGEGCWGEPCTEDDDCYSDICVIDQGEGVCSMTCLNDCPAGFSCVLESPDATDPVWICASDHEKLCQPCAVSSECTSFSDIESLCVPYISEEIADQGSTLGNFCATTCETDDECPSGFSCAETADQLNELVSVCVHDELACDCSSQALDLELQTACTIVNGSGVCAGARVCSENGLEACDAPVATGEVCDGVDQDCDDQIDEGLAPISCGLGECKHETASCVAGAPVACDPLEGAAEELCDGLDNDCDGQTDEEQGSLSCGVGVCVHEAPACVNGELALCDHFKGASNEICDGVDNDCDGIVDEVDAEGCLFHYADSDQDGHGAGVPLCLCAPEGDHTQPVATDCNDLDPLVHPGIEEICNGLDDNCDGEVDEAQGSLSCGQGQCAQTKPACANGLVQQCDPFEGAQAEVCDGLDNDCDGLVDEDLGDLACGQGVCAKTIAACVDGVPQACDPFAGASDELCDGLDNDCDGKVDEGLGKISCGTGVCAKSVQACVGGVSQTCDALSGASNEVCDGLDNDCDGKVDEGLGKISCGKGVCAKSVQACVGGQTNTCDAFAGSSSEKCDGLDNDCDGKVDEGLGKISCGKGVCAKSVQACVGGQTNTCNAFAGASNEKCDGLDNDCDGSVDEGVCTVQSSSGCN